MRTFRRILFWTVVLVCVGVVAAYWWQRPLLRTGTGYAAHNACAVTHIAGRENFEDDLPDNPLVPYLRSRDIGEDQVRASLLGLFSRQVAWYQPGFGCTLSSYRPDLGRPALVGPEANPFAEAPRPDPPRAIAEAVDEAFGRDLSEEDKTELGTRAVLILKSGELIAERYAEGFGPDVPQLGWSMSKSVTNLLVGRLVKRGEISLGQDELRPEWTDERADITVEDLLRMTSGLEWDETYDLGTPITQMLYDEPNMGDFVASQPAVHEPGTYQQYSSGSTTLLCAILGDETKMHANLPRRMLFAPLGLASAVLEPDAAGTPVCSSYMWATPRDWVAVGQFALQEGRWNGEELLPRNWMDLSTRAVDVEESEEDGYGASWWVNREADGSLVEPSLPPDTYWARGHDGQRMIIVPSEDLVVLRLGFSPELEDVGAMELTADVIEALS